MYIVEFLFWISLSIIVYTYLGYGIVLYLLVKIKELFSPRKTGQLPDELPEITLLIAAFNEELVVEEKMKNCSSLNYPTDKLHIYWVTDGSNDNTNALLANYPEVTTLYEPAREGKTAALNRALPFIKTPLVVFTDANTMLNADAIREIAICFVDEKVGCVAGEKRVALQEKGNAATSGEGIYWKYESVLKELDARLHTAVGAAGELFAIRTHLFETMDKDTLLDDFILSLRIVQKGYKIDYCSKAYAVEGGSASIRDEKKRKVRIAAGGIQSIGRLKSLLNPFKHGILTFQYVSHRVLRWSITPILLFLLLPINIALVALHAAPIYLFILAAQLLFYLLGLGGYYLSTKEIKNKVLYIPYYFLFMNSCVIEGFFYVQKKKGTGVWEKSKRA